MNEPTGQAILILSYNKASGRPHDAFHYSNIPYHGLKGKLLLLLASFS